jgi:predicted  nucleic acid-binding Zn-ribbon protein
MDATISIALAGVSFLGVLVVGIWLKYMFTRFIRTFDDKIADLKELLSDKVDVKVVEVLQRDLDDLSKTCATGESVSVVSKSIDEIKSKIEKLDNLKAEFLEKFTRRGDFIREMQTLNSQLEIIQRKIDNVDERTQRRTKKHVREENEDDIE